MSSVVGDIVTFFEASIETAVLTLKKSKFYYDLEKNPGTKDNYVYAVRPGSGSPVDGTIRSTTLRQDFEVEISRDFFGAEVSDVAIRAAVNQIFEDIEKITKEVAYRRTASILLIESPSFDAPVLNQNGRSVSVTFTYPVTYRKSIL